MLYVFAGRPGRADSFAECVVQAAREKGWAASVREIDRERGQEHDMADDLTWAALLSEIKEGCFDDGALWSPPCSTFSGARRYDGGPRPLRGASGQERYGFAHLKPKEKEAVRLGTLLALRTAEGVQALQARGAPWLWENPPGRPGGTSMWMLDEVARATTGPGIHVSQFAQCMVGGEYGKRMAFRGTVRIPAGECEHPALEWCLPPDGRVLSAAHPLCPARFGRCSSPTGTATLRCSGRCPARTS